MSMNVCLKMLMRRISLSTWIMERLCAFVERRWRSTVKLFRGGQGMTLVVRITGGPDGRIEVPFMI